MAYNNFNDGQDPQYYYYYPTSSAPTTFREPSAYNLDDTYRRDYRRQDGAYCDQSRQGFRTMAGEYHQDSYGAGAANPWYWQSSDYIPQGGRYDGNYQLYPWQCNDGSPSTDDHRRSSTTVEMYVPLCCDECERKVRKHLKGLDGVESVSANQWEKKVVVQGYDLHPQFLLRRIQRDKPTSVFWSDRPS